MKYLEREFKTYDELRDFYKKNNTVDIIPIRKGDEIFFWKTPEDVIEFLIRWDSQWSYYDPEKKYKQPVVEAKVSAFEPMTRMSSLEHHPILYIVLLDEPDVHPTYGPYVGWGVEHTNAIRRFDKDNPLRLKREKL